jgi:uroporphyrin-III C-methyltransferase
MSGKAPSVEKGLPEIAYGSVWLVSAGDGDPRHLSRLAVHALRTADAVIHDAGVALKILDLVNPGCYREAAAPGQAVERAINLAQDGWRVVYLVEGNTMERTVECAIQFAEKDIPFRVAPDAGDPIIGDAPIGLVLVRRPLSPGGADPRSTLVVLLGAPQSGATTLAQTRQAPLGFSMSGLAG